MSTSTITGSLSSAPTLSTAGSQRIPRPLKSRRIQMLTLAKAVDRVLSMEEINPGESRAVDRAIEAVMSARQSFVSYAPSGFHYYDARINLSIDGAYDLGACTVASNVVTPTNSSFPSWTDLSHMRVNNRSYPVMGYSGSTFEVDGTLADGSYTSATLEQLFVPLPQNFRRRGSITDGVEQYPIEDMTAGVLQSYQDWYNWGRNSATQHAFAAVTGDTRFQGQLMLFMWPPYTTAQTLSMFYERYPESLDVHRYGTGELDVSGTTVTADDAIFTSDHVGSALIIGVDNDTEIRNSLSSRDLVQAQRIITSYTDANTVEVDESLAVTNRTFYISDVVDVHPGPQSEAFLRLCEYELARQSKSKTAPIRQAQFMEQLQLALADDNRYREIVDGNSEGWGFGIGSVDTSP